MQLRLVKHTSRLANKTGDSLEQSEPWQADFAGSPRRSVAIYEYAP